MGWHFDIDLFQQLHHMWLYYSEMLANLFCLRTSCTCLGISFDLLGGPSPCWIIVGFRKHQLIQLKYFDFLYWWHSIDLMITNSFWLFHLSSMKGLCFLNSYFAWLFSNEVLQILLDSFFQFHFFTFLISGMNYFIV